MGLFDTWNVENFRVTLASTCVIPGGAVSGNLTFTVTKPMTFRSVTIKVMAKECTHVAVQRSSGSGKRRRTRTHHYYGRSNAYKQHLTILGGLKGVEFKDELPPGNYNFPFAFILPPNAPPSIPSCGTAGASGALSWFVKAEIDIPFSFTDSNAVAPFVVATAMPVSQYMSRQPFASPMHHAKRMCCCCDQGVTAIQMNLAQNMVVFGRDKTLEGNISIDNTASKADSEVIMVSLNRVCWIRAQGYERTPSVVIGNATIQSGMKAGDSEKRFNFSIPLNDNPALVSVYRGQILFHYYQIIATCDGDTLFSVNIIASNALDESNRSAPLNPEIAGPLVEKKQYQQFVYAPPPGAQPGMPNVPGNFFPQPRQNVQPLQYQTAAQAPPPPTFMSNMGTDMSIYGPPAVVDQSFE